MNIEQQIMLYKKRLETLRDERSKKQGTLESVQERLKTEYGLESEADIDKFLTEKQISKEEKEKELKSILETIEEKYGHLFK